MKKLTIYFAIFFVFFAVIISATFSNIFNSHNINLQTTELIERAAIISTNISDVISYSIIQRGGTVLIQQLPLRNFLLSIQNIARADVWVFSAVQDFSNTIHLIPIYNSEQVPEGSYEVMFNALNNSEVYYNILDGILVASPILGINDELFGTVLIYSEILINREAGAFAIFTLSTSISLLVSFLFCAFLFYYFRLKENERLENLRRDFIANISHELRTPITVLKGSLEAIEDGIITDEKILKEFNKEMLKETVFLERLVRDLLDLSNIQAGLTLEKTTINLKEVTEDAIKAMAKIAKEKNITIAYNLNNLQINADYTRIRQLLIILLENAIKFSPKESTINVSINLNCLTVKDNGLGISEEELPHIFTRFYKHRGEENKQGTGLGLVIAKEIAEKHGIKINVDSKKNKGTEVSLTWLL
ncbi:MAG: HAMP domain-containing histidine kinase [Defluviitaleaceae bacterium]|nr:HAMP domain-containing histidine kinase [Defluviitaleaceae bacterium]